MRKPVAFFALDLEMEQPSNEILSIGVAYQGVDGDILCRNFLITPSHPISDYIQKLTGLKDVHFDWDKTRGECFERFIQFQQSIKRRFEREGVRLHHEPVTWGPGDVPLLLSQLPESVAAPISRRCIDLKTLIMMERHHKGLSISSKMSLRTAMSYYKLPLSGEQHNSMWDATNTLNLFARYNEKQVRQRQLIEQLTEAL